MNQHKRIITIRENILEELYKQATPGGDLQKLRERQHHLPEPFSRLHYLSEEKTIQIINEELKKYELTKQEEEIFNHSGILSDKPLEELHMVNTYRKKSGLEPISEEEL